MNHIIATVLIVDNILIRFLYLDRILQLQQLIVDVQSKLNHEQKDREVDQHDLSSR